MMTIMRLCYTAHYVLMFPSGNNEGILFDFFFTKNTFFSAIIFSNLDVSAYHNVTNKLFSLNGKSMKTNLCNIESDGECSGFLDWKLISAIIVDTGHRRVDPGHSLVLMSRIKYFSGVWEHVNQRHF